MPDCISLKLFRWLTDHNRHALEKNHPATVGTGKTKQIYCFLKIFTRSHSDQRQTYFILAKAEMIVIIIDRWTFILLSSVVSSYLVPVFLMETCFLTWGVVRSRLNTLARLAGVWAGRATWSARNKGPIWHYWGNLIFLGLCSYRCSLLLAY